MEYIWLLYSSKYDDRPQYNKLSLRIWYQFPYTCLHFTLFLSQEDGKKGKKDKKGKKKKDKKDKKDKKGKKGKKGKGKGGDDEVWHFKNDVAVRLREICEPLNF